jgi:hypothetical protein
MARKISGGLSGSPSVGALNVAPTAVVTAATDQDITISPEGTASVVFTNNAILNAQSDLRFGDADSSNWVAFQAPATVASNVTWTLPNADGSNNQVLTTNASGILAWTTKTISIANNTTDSAQYNVTLTSANSGDVSVLTTTDTKMQFQPSTGLLTTSELTVNGTARSLVTENVQTTSYTFALTDRNKVVAMNNSSDATLTIPNDSAVNFPVGSMLYAVRVGTGAVTLATAAGVTATRTGQFASNEEIYIRKRSANNWIVVDQPRTLSGSGGAITTSAGYTIHTYTSGSDSFIVT